MSRLMSQLFEDQANEAQRLREQLQTAKTERDTARKLLREARAERDHWRSRAIALEGEVQCRRQ